MKALFYLKGAADGGSEFVVSSIAAFARANGIVAALASAGNGPSPVGLRWQAAGSPYFFLNTPTEPTNSAVTRASPQFTSWWTGLLKKEHPEVVVANNGGYPWHSTCLAAVRLARAHGVLRVYLAIHSTPEADGTWGSELHADEEVASSCDAIILGSGSLRDAVVRSRPALTERTRVIRYGVASGKETALPQESDLQRIGFAAEMRGPEKGQLVLLESLALLPASPNRWVCCLAGDGPYIEELRLAVMRLRVPVEFLGRVSSDQMPAFYRSLSIYVLPSFQEGLSLTVLEAMANGVPVVTTEVGGHSDAVLHGQTGLLIPPGDHLALAEALGRLLNDKLTQTAMGAAGRRRYEELFTLDSHLDAWVRLLRGVNN